MSTAPMAAIRPVNSSHWRTDLVTTWAASTSGGGGGGASAWPLLQAVMTVAMTTMAMAERPPWAMRRSSCSSETLVFADFGGLLRMGPPFILILATNMDPKGVNR